MTSLDWLLADRRVAGAIGVEIFLVADGVLIELPDFDHELSGPLSLLRNVEHRASLRMCNHQ
jgi:hypothetical protein